MVLVLDIGGTHIRIAEVRGSKVRKKKVFDTPSQRKEILSLVCELIKEYGSPKKVGIALAGTLRGGIALSTPHLDLNNTDVGGIIQRHCKTRAYIENDAKCAALAELNFGAAKKKQNVILLTIGTGIGGAIIANGKLWKGNGNAGEFGHMFLPEGEFEQLASGSSALSRAHSLNIPAKSGEDLKHLATLHDPRAQAIYHEIGRQLGTGILNLVHAFDPELVILGGGFSSFKPIYTPLRHILDNYDIFQRNVPVVHAKFGDDAGLIGAGLLFN